MYWPRQKLCSQQAIIRNKSNHITLNKYVSPSLSELIGYASNGGIGISYRKITNYPKVGQMTVTYLN